MPGSPSFLAILVPIALLTLSGCEYIGIVDVPDAGSTQPDASVEYSCGPGAWRLAGHLSPPRRDPIVVLLPAGEVLIAGGSYDNPGFLNLAELYSPTTGTSRRIASLASARAGASHVLLRDGTVLVIGGDYSGPDTLERYLPAEDRWIPAGTLPVTREFGSTATELEDGRVLITQGIYDSEAQRYRTHPILWDPTTHAFTPTGPFPRDLNGASATRLRDGSVLLAGGVSVGGAMSPTSEAFLYRPERDEWIPTGRMYRPRAYHSATLLMDGRVLIAGGAVAVNNELGNTSELYEPLTGTFQQAGSSRAIHSAHTDTLLPSGEVLITGGSFAQADVELFQPWTNRWTQARASLIKRYSASAVLLPDGDVLLLGGVTQSNEARLVAEIEHFSCAP